MFSTKPLKNKITNLEDELFRVSQIKQNLDELMLTLTLDGKGCVIDTNPQVQIELGFSENQLDGMHYLI
ncbi:hypothetical protein L1266_16050 [Pseudoalteromonas sp. Cn5-37]|uniref:hypothetical protein n=1 Tax=Pseudoalteromonas sp. Cn5-37 TaxID=2908886 RepID=UPI001F31931D|nr:hypothetical protein [Pseudoalteromonas sp. Cn5-37]